MSAATGLEVRDKRSSVGPVCTGWGTFEEEGGVSAGVEGPAGSVGSAKMSVSSSVACDAVLINALISSRRLCTTQRSVYGTTRWQNCLLVRGRAAALCEVQPLHPRQSNKKALHLQPALVVLALCTALCCFDCLALEVRFEDVPPKVYPLDGCDQGAPERACIMMSLVDEAQVGSHGGITGAACNSSLETLSYSVSIEMGLLP